MDFLRFINLGTMSIQGLAHSEKAAPAQSDYEGLNTLVHDAHLRRDIARREDLTPFVRDLDRAA